MQGRPKGLGSQESPRRNPGALTLSPTTRRSAQARKPATWPDFLALTVGGLELIEPGSGLPGGEAGDEDDCEG